jgi:long-chain acyl-CoA synthetase
MPTLNYPTGPLHEVMRATAERFPDRPAITFKDTVMTFADFDRESNRLRTVSLRSGSRRRPHGAVSPQLPAVPARVLCGKQTGRDLMPDESFVPRTRNHVPRQRFGREGHGDARQPVAGRPSLPFTLPNLVRVVVTGDEILRDGTCRFDDVVDSGSAVAPDVVVEQSQVAALPYSSGTTGLPKGVMLTHRTLVCNQLQYLHGSGIGSDDVYPIFLPLSHIYGVMLMNAALGSGARQIVMERFDLEALVATIEAYGVTVLHLVPPVLLALANAAGLDRSQFRTVRYALSAAAPLAPDVARRVEQRLGLRVIQAYGLTETGPASHHSPLEPEQGAAGERRRRHGRHRTARRRPRERREGARTG